MAVTQTLSVTEVSGSVNTSANTSKVRILWQSTQTGDSWNGYPRTAKYYVSVNGGAETEYSVSYTLPKNATNTIVDTTITVAHKSDGSGTVKVRTWMDTSISAGVVEKTQTITLTTIPRASTITSASNRTLGNTCIVKWTPLSASFRYKLKFTLGGFSYTTGAIHPNTTSVYTYTGYTLDIAAIAPKITTNPPTATMTVTLYTYSDSGATTQVGSASSKTFKVTVPDNSTTKPDVTMALTPVSSLGSAFAGLYIQGKSRVKANITGVGKYGATIASYGMTVLGNGYASPFQTEHLSQSGTVTVYGRAKDSRGFVTEIPQDITVIQYSKPKLIPGSESSTIICSRCDASGNLTESGAYLKIKVGRSYSKVMSGSTQKNFCLLRYRYKVATASDFSNYFTLLAKDDTSTDYADVTLGNVVTSLTTSYTVELSVIDDIGDTATLTFVVPTEEIAFHLKEGGDGAAFGKYAERANALDIASDWDMYFKGDKIEKKFYSLRGHTKIPSGADLNDYKTPDVYAIEADAHAANIANMPPFKRSGLLIVYAGTGQDTVAEGTWKYIVQEYRCLYSTIPTYRRTISSNGEGVWTYETWQMEKGLDTGWVELTKSGHASTPTTVARGGAGCFYRAINENHIFVRFNCAFTFSGSSINLNSVTIPSQYRPKNNAHALCPVNDRGIARASVATDGYIYVNYVQNMATASTTTSFEVGWIDGYIDYWL